MSFKEIGLKIKLSKAETMIWEIEHVALEVVYPNTANCYKFKKKKEKKLT